MKTTLSFRYFFTDYDHITFDISKKDFIIASSLPCVDFFLRKW